MPSKGHRKVPVEDFPELILRYQAGATLKELAAAAGVSYQTIGRILENESVELRGHQMTQATRRKISEIHRLQIDLELLKAMHSQQMSCREMAAVLDCDEETVRSRLIELDLPRLAAKARPEQNYFWKGGFAVDADGYILQHAPDHPNANASGYVRQHRLVMEAVLGRYLLSTEVVDHVNGDTSDNRPANLRVFPRNSEHLRTTLKGRQKMPAEERERLRQSAVQRARARVTTILAESGNDADS